MPEDQWKYASLSTIYQQSWLTREVPVDWMLVNGIPIYKNVRKEDPGNYIPVSLALVLGEFMEQIFLNVIRWHMRDN